MVAFQALSGAIIWGQGVCGEGLSQFTPFRQQPEKRKGQQEGPGGWGEASLESFSKGGGPRIPILPPPPAIFQPTCLGLSRQLEREIASGLCSLCFLVGLLCCSLLSPGREAPGATFDLQEGCSCVQGEPCPFPHFSLPPEVADQTGPPATLAWAL